MALRKTQPTKSLKVVYNASVKDKIDFIKGGASKNDLIKIKDQLDVDYDKLSQILSVSRAKLLSKKPKEKFDQTTSERIMLVSDVVGFGEHVFEDMANFRDWLKRENKALGNKSPIEMMDTVYGIQEVKNEIGRIESGVY
jgi:putative toxin-antitoxin system antitoxin component (TIGR02293 family)